VEEKVGLVELEEIAELQALVGTLILEKRDKMKTICQMCNKEFNVKPSRLKRGEGKFCSKNCVRKSQSKKEIVMCENCGKEILIKLSRKKLGQFKFCSRKCQGEWYYKRSIKICSICKKEFYNKWQCHKYCSKECRIIAKRGKNNPMWKGGITPFKKLLRDSAKNREWVKAIFERDSWTCQECGRHRKVGDRVILEVHHKKELFIILAEFLKEYDQFSPFEDQDTLLRLAMKWQPFWDTDNGVTLCYECHQLTKKELASCLV
jgi:hypothetical protein